MAHLPLSICPQLCISTYPIKITRSLGIPLNTRKPCDDGLLLLLTKLFNRSQQQGWFPNYCKTWLIFAIHQRSSYRQIAIVLLMIILHAFYAHMLSNNIIFPAQDRSRKLRSCVECKLDFVKHFLQLRDLGLYFVIDLFDCS